MPYKKCDYCHSDITPGDPYFELKLEMYAAPEMPEITSEDLEVDHMEELQSLIDAMEEMDTDELTDEVYECYVFTLCKKCRDEIHARLKHNKDKKKSL